MSAAHAPAEPFATRHRVVVSRDEPAHGPLSEQLRAFGLEVLRWAVLRIVPPADPAPLERALSDAARLDWIVFASRHAVEAVTARLPIPPPGVRTGAVGASTAEALREARWPATVVPDTPTAAGLIEAMTPLVARGNRVLLPASSRALPTLVEGLTRLGAELWAVEAYRTEAAPLDVPACRTLIERAAVHAVTFTSPSAVEELERALGKGLFERLLEHASAVTLGPTTARALAERGYASVLAEPPGLAGLARTTFQVLKLRP
jgi:uroporphyrinogen-III synthase